MKNITSSLLLAACAALFLGACDKQSAKETKLLSPKYHGEGHGEAHGADKAHGGEKAHGADKGHEAAPAKAAH